MTSHIETPNLKTPKFKKFALKELVDRVGFIGFSKQVISMNPEIHVDYTTMETLWNFAIIRVCTQEPAALVLTARSQVRSKQSITTSQSRGSVPQLTM